MKQLILVLAMIVCIGGIRVSTANAQSADTIAVSIPFAFTVSNRSFPAGDYLLRRSIQGAGVVMQLRHEPTKESVQITMHTLRRLDIQKKSKLVFNCYGDQYFLSQIWIAGRSQGNELPKTRAERILQRNLAKKQRKPTAIEVATQDVRQR